NPHYKPEIQAQTTLINFTVTKDGLEEQLLGDVVKPKDLIRIEKSRMTTQQNTFKITLKKLEDDLLHRRRAWGGIKYLSQIEDFQNLEKDIEGAAKRWKKFVESETPERETFPQDWKNKTALQRLCIMRCLRLDRMTYAI
ncbi:hypothetical protein K0M31_012525, partial [Melipona bicolor]